MWHRTHLLSKSVEGLYLCSCPEDSPLIACRSKRNVSRNTSREIKGTEDLSRTIAVCENYSDLSWLDMTRTFTWDNERKERLLDCFRWQEIRFHLSLLVVSWSCHHHLLLLHFYSPEVFLCIPYSCCCLFGILKWNWSWPVLSTSQLPGAFVCPLQANGMSRDKQSFDKPFVARNQFVCWGNSSPGVYL